MDIGSITDGDYPNKHIVEANLFSRKVRMNHFAEFTPEKCFTVNVAEFIPVICIGNLTHAVA